ncbi:hypothetical protein EDD22DRAFT_851002 [Suillus occidentalis]|nr:hypothetical protein EDD22DRAFT_851002 [Suillus occidentalis]
MPDSLSPTTEQPRVHVIANFTLNFQLASVHTPSSSDVVELCGTECEKFIQMKELVNSGTQTTGTEEKSESKSILESELCRIREQLMDAETNIAYLSNRVGMYRHRWLEDYHRAENLERHMPDDIYIPHLDQIPEGAPSPSSFLPEAWNLEYGGSDD